MQQTQQTQQTVVCRLLDEWLHEDKAVNLHEAVCGILDILSLRAPGDFSAIDWGSTSYHADHPDYKAVKERLSYAGAKKDGLIVESVGGPLVETRPLLRWAMTDQGTKPSLGESFRSALAALPAPYPERCEELLSETEPKPMWDEARLHLINELLDSNPIDVCVRKDVGGPDYDPPDTLDDFVRWAVRLNQRLTAKGKWHAQRLGLLPPTDPEAYKIAVQAQAAVLEASERVGGGTPTETIDRAEAGRRLRKQRDLKGPAAANRVTAWLKTSGYNEHAIPLDKFADWLASQPPAKPRRSYDEFDID